MWIINRISFVGFRDELTCCREQYCFCPLGTYVAANDIIHVLLFLQPVADCKYVLLKGTIRNKLAFKERGANSKSPCSCIPDLSDTVKGCNASSRYNGYLRCLHYLLEEVRSFSVVTIGQQVQPVN